MTDLQSDHRNVEIKARVPEPGELKLRVMELADRGPARIAQEDVFFHSNRGRLKLRKFADGSAELIFYDRPDDPGPAQSKYVRSDCADPAALELSLERALGVRCVVRKTRTLYRIGRTRVHLDDVDDLGSYMELEVVLAGDERVEEGYQTALALMAELGIHEGELVSEAYVDLLERARAAGGSDG